MAWVTVCLRGDIPADRGWPVRVGERRIAVFADGDRLCALDNACVHIGNPIDDGQVRSGCVTCPWHGWKYDLHTGELLTAFGRRRGLVTYPVRLHGQDVQVEVELD